MTTTANQLVEDSVTRFAELVDALPAIAWRADALTFRFSFVSKAVERILGFPAQQWLDDPELWPRQIHPDDRGVINICHTETVACRSHEFTYRIFAADGHLVWLRDQVSVRMENGVPVEIFGVMSDVTEAKRAEEALERSEANHRRMLENLPDGFGVHVHGRFVYVNHELMRILAATDSSQLIGQPALSFVHPEDRLLVSARQAELSAGRTVPLVRERLLSLDGQVVEVEAAATPVTYNGAEAMQVVVRDLSERLEAERELQALDERLRALATGTKEAMWEWNLTTGDLWTNSGHYDLFLPEGEQASVDDWIDRIHPGDRERVRLRSQHNVETVARSWSDEYRFRFPDGEYGWILDRGSVIPGPDGKAHRMIGEMLDVTALRRAEEQRNAAETKFRSIVENSLVGIYVISAGRFVYINATGAAIFGWEADEILALEQAALLICESDRETASWMFRPELGRVGPAARFTAHCTHRNGREITIEFFGSVSNIDGEVCTIGTMLDVTAHRHAKEELERSQQRYRDLVEEVRDVIYSVDPEGRFTSINAAFETLTGFTAADWIGRPFTDIVVEESIVAAVGQFERAQRGADIVGQYKIRSKSGTVLDIEASGHAKIVDGRAVGTVGIIRDMTARNVLERKVEESKRLASLGHLAASMAHEFNNVLMSIQPFTEIMARDSAALPRSADACRHIFQAVARGKKVTQEILRFANPQQAELDTVKIAPWLEDALAQAGAGIPPQIMISTIVHPDCDQLLVDRNQLDQVFVNLLFNARDAMPDGGSIVVEIAPAESRWHQELSLERAARYIRISVIDSGTGIAADILPRIFDPLFTTKRSGTGLGLSIARKLIEGQGGVISVESAPGRGTRFHLFLRRGSSQAPVERIAEATNLAVRRVVLVEDEISVAEGVTQILSFVGVETRHVELGGAAAAAIRDFAPDAVIVDLNLPDMSGMDVCKAIRAEWPDLPIVIATGHVDLSVGHDQVHTVSLMKPYSLDDLLEAIRAARN
ncbi:MAG: PAS domain S-box protein [Thermoanaerobaculia bacterium]